MNTHADPPKSIGRKIALTLFLLLGVSHMIGTLITPLFPNAGKAIGGIGRLTLASPHPKVFCQVGEHEPFGFAFHINLNFDQGPPTTVTLDAEAYSKLPGPYMYRNVYGAVFAFAPFLDQTTTDAALQYGLCDSNGDLRSILPDETRVLRSATIHIQPRGKGPQPPPLHVECTP